MPRFAANLSLMFQEVAFLDRFRAASGVGFRGVEYLFPYDVPAAEIASRLRDNGLTQVLFNMPPGNWAGGERGLAVLPGRRQEFADGVERAIDYAGALGCAQVHAMAGIPPAGVSPEAAEAAYLENVAQAAGRCRAAGIRLVIEPINTRDMPGYFLTTSSQARRLMTAVGSDNLFLQADLYHWQIMEGDLAERIRANQDLIRHVQIAGNPGRHEPDVGEIHYPYLFALLDELGYTGWIGCEYRPRGETTAGLGWARPYGIASATKL